MSIVQINELQKKFDNHTILDINKYTIDACKGYVFYGYNGCGKTTLLRLIAGLEKPSSGTLDISIPKKERIMCFQTPYMFTGTVEKNLEYGIRLQKLTPDRKRLQTLCERYGIDNVLHKNARVLSSGQKQAVALIRALLTNPKLLLLDEPVANLDKNKVDALNGDLTSLKKDGGSFVITMHSNQRLLFDIDHCCLLENGNLFNDEKCASRKVRSESGHPSELTSEENELMTKINTYVIDGGIACSDAFRVCDEHSVQKGIFVDLCNKRNIKIRKCQWGCFK